MKTADAGESRLCTILRKSLIPPLKSQLGCLVEHLLGCLRAPESEKFGTHPAALGYLLDYYDESRRTEQK